MSHVCPEQTYIFPRSNSRWQFSRHPGFTRSQVSPGPQAPCHAISALGRVGVVQHPPELMVTVAQLVSHFSHQLPETPPPPAQSPEQGRASSQRHRSGTFCSVVVRQTRVEGASPRGDCREMPCQRVTLLGEGSRVNSHCPVLSAAVARYTGLFGQLPCLSVCLGDAG